MIGIICLIVEGCSSCMLVFEDFSEDSFGVSWLTINSLAISLDAHSSTMDRIELILDVVRCPWWSLSTSSCSWVSIIITLSNWWSWDFNLSSWSRYQILCLIAARLEHKTLVLFWCGNVVILDGRRVNWLPSVLGSRWHLTILYHSINNLLIVSSLAFPLSVFLVNKSHWKLTNVDWMVRILHNDILLLLFVLLIRVLRLLNRSESTTSHLVVVAASSLINCVGSTGRYAHGLTTCLDVSFTNILWLNWLMYCLEHCSSVVAWSIIAWGSGREESWLSRRVLILSGIKVGFLRLILSSSCACGNTSNMCSICCITVLTLYWLHYRII